MAVQLILTLDRLIKHHTIDDLDFHSPVAIFSAV